MSLVPWFQNTFRYGARDEKTCRYFAPGCSLRVENSKGRLLAALSTCPGIQKFITLDCFARFTEIRMHIKCLYEQSNYLFEFNAA